MAEEKQDTEAAAESGSKSKLALLENKAVLLGAIVIAQAVLAIALTQFMIVPKLNVQSAAIGAESVPALETAPDIGILVGLEEIIVTLQSDSKVPRYVRIHVNLEMSDQAAADLVVARLPQLRDIVIMVLSAKDREDLQRPEGRKGIRDEIFRRLADKLPKDSLLNIYFSDLVIQ